MISCPVFRGSHQLRPYRLSSMAFGNKPALYEPYWNPGVAAVRMGAQSNFKEADYCALLGFCDIEVKRHVRGRVAAKNRSEFPLVFFYG